MLWDLCFFKKKKKSFLLFLTNNADSEPALEQPGDVALPPWHPLPPGPGESGLAAVSRAAAL